MARVSVVTPDDAMNVLYKDSIDISFRKIRQVNLHKIDGSSTRNSTPITFLQAGTTGTGSKKNIYKGWGMTEVAVKTNKRLPRSETAFC